MRRYAAYTLVYMDIFMKTIDLPELINDDIQDLMMDVFETLGALSSDILQIEHFLLTKKYYLEAMNLLDSTNYLADGDNATLVKAIRFDVESETSDLSERLAYCWRLQKINLEQAVSQKNFNSTFALFVPLIIGFMNECSPNIAA